MGDEGVLDRFQREPVGQMGDGVGVGSLQRALTDESRPVRLQAAWALATKLGGQRPGG